MAEYTFPFIIFIMSQILQPLKKIILSLRKANWSLLLKCYCFLFFILKCSFLIFAIKQNYFQLSHLNNFKKVILGQFFLLFSVISLLFLVSDYDFILCIFLCTTFFFQFMIKPECDRLWKWILPGLFISYIYCISLI